jgi:hypothetical protein
MPRTPSRISHPVALGEIHTDLGLKQSKVSVIDSESWRGMRAENRHRLFLIPL